MIRCALLAQGLLLSCASIAQAQVVTADISSVWLGGGSCHFDSRSSGLSVGVAAAGSGTWFVGGAAGVIVAPIGSVDCLSYMPLAEFEGRVVEVRGSTEHDPSGRARIEAGVRLSAIDSELVAGVGFVGMRTWYPAGTWYSRELSLQPWLGIAALVLSPESPFGIRVEMGRHRTPFRYYWAEGGMAAHRSLWHNIYSVGLAIRLHGGKSEGAGHDQSSKQESAS